MYVHRIDLSCPLIDPLAAKWWQQLGGDNGCNLQTYPLSAREAGHFSLLLLLLLLMFLLDELNTVVTGMERVVSAQREDSSRRIVAHDKYDRRKTRIWKIADQII